jgi:hypothetical protein
MLKQCSHTGCNKHAKNGGFCITHGVEMKLADEGCTKYPQGKDGGTNSNNNPTLQPSIDIIPAIPPFPSVHYEDEEERNSWIWRSSRIVPI